MPKVHASVTDRLKWPPPSQRGLINIQAPQGLATGSAVPVQIAMGGVTSSNQVTIAVQ